MKNRDLERKGASKPSLWSTEPPPTVGKWTEERSKLDQNHSAKRNRTLDLTKRGEEAQIKDSPQHRLLRRRRLHSTVSTLVGETENLGLSLSRILFFMGKRKGSGPGTLRIVAHLDQTVHISNGGRITPEMSNWTAVMWEVAVSSYGRELEWIEGLGCPALWRTVRRKPGWQARHVFIIVSSYFDVGCSNGCCHQRRCRHNN